MGAAIIVEYTGGLGCLVELELECEQIDAGLIYGVVDTLDYAIWLGVQPMNIVSWCRMARWRLPTNSANGRAFWSCRFIFFSWRRCARAGTYRCRWQR